VRTLEGKQRPREEELFDKKNSKGRTGETLRGQRKGKTREGQGTNKTASLSGEKL
jgi:hypothetical protein